MLRKVYLVTVAGTVGTVLFGLFSTRQAADEAIEEAKEEVEGGPEFRVQPIYSDLIGEEEADEILTPVFPKAPPRLQPSDRPEQQPRFDRERTPREGPGESRRGYPPRSGQPSERRGYPPRSGQPSERRGYPPRSGQPAERSGYQGGRPHGEPWGGNRQGSGYGERPSYNKPSSRPWEKDSPSYSPRRSPEGGYGDRGGSGDRGQRGFSPRPQGAKRGKPKRYPGGER